MIVWIDDHFWGILIGFLVYAIVHLGWAFYALFPRRPKHYTRMDDAEREHFLRSYRYKTPPEA